MRICEELCMQMMQTKQICKALYKQAVQNNSNNPIVGIGCKQIFSMILANSTECKRIMRFCWNILLNLILGISMGITREILRVLSGDD